MLCMSHSCTEAIGSLVMPEQVLELRLVWLQVTLEGLQVYWKHGGNALGMLW